MLFAVVLFFASCANDTDKTNDENVTDDQKSEMKVVTVANFETEVADLVDEQVKITGIVDHVCKHGGKKIVLVNDGSDNKVHVESEEAFEQELAGSEVTVIGIVREFRVDEAYCQQLENETSEQYIEGEDHESDISMRKEEAQFYRDSMATAGVDHLSFYSLEFVSFE
ncbi:MAG: hypothetical protein JXL97_01805 [Bacteroidales bacterium]|nr:hypothetical protein [Bacteroidales bacterium]